MSRRFNDVASTYISLGDLSSARFQDLSAWTYLCFWRHETVTDERCFISKWTAVTAQKHAFFRTEKATPTHLEIYLNDTNFITTTATFSTNTWYFFAITNDGTGTNGINVYVYNMAGTLVSSESGDHPGDPSDLTAPLIIAARGTSEDRMDGDLAYQAYFTEEFTQAEVKAFLINPYQILSQKRNNCVFFLPLNGSSPEVDYSGNRNNGTVSGSPILSPMPPLSAFISKPPVFLEIAGGITLNVTVHD